MACLETQPPELLLSILCAFDSLVDLHSFISASPRCLQVFLANRNRILWAVLRRAIHHNAFGLAIAAVTAPVVSPYAYPCERDTILCDFVCPLIEQDPDFIEYLAQYVDVCQLARLHINVERLLDEYIREAIPTLAACCDPALGQDCDEPDHPSLGIEEHDAVDGEDTESTERPCIKISDTERARLHTAFYLFEVYCRAFDYTSNGREVPTSIQCDLFIKELQSWEIEQLASLLFFFVSRLAHYFELIQRQFIADVRREAIPNTHSETTGSGQSSSSTVQISTLKTIELQAFHGVWSTNKYADLSALACRGLRFIGKVHNPRTSSDHRIELLRATEGLCFTSLDAALDTTRTMRKWGNSMDNFPRKEIGQGNSTMPNKFFEQYSETDVWQISSIMKPKRLALRATGYVFWDSSRIDQEHIHEALWRSTEKNAVGLGRFLPLQDPSADTLVVGLHVPKTIWDMLNKKYAPRGFGVPERQWSEAENEMPREFHEEWENAVVGWWDDDWESLGGGWLSALEYSAKGESRDDSPY